MVKHFISTLFVILFVATCSSYATVNSDVCDLIDQMQKPLEKKKIEDTKTSMSLFKAPGLGLLWFYQNYISTQDVPSCMFRPSCSQFAVQCLKETNILKALLLTSDRLIRCNGLSIGNYQINPLNGKAIDPVARYIAQPDTSH